MGTAFLRNGQVSSDSVLQFTCRFLTRLGAGIMDGKNTEVLGREAPHVKCTTEGSNVGVCAFRDLHEHAEMTNTSFSWRWAEAASGSATRLTKNSEFTTSPLLQNPFSRCSFSQANQSPIHLTQLLTSRTRDVCLEWTLPSYLLHIGMQHALSASAI